jgi:hypothetical protein
MPLKHINKTERYKVNASSLENNFTVFYGSQVIKVKFQPLQDSLDTHWQFAYTHPVNYCF